MRSLSIENSIERATALSHRVVQAEGMLASARDYANDRWVEEKQSFMDLKATSGHPHIVNTSTALTVIAIHPQLFQPEELQAYQGVNLERVVHFYAKENRTDGDGKHYWPSKDTHTWSPYVTALSVGAISRCALLSDLAQRRTVLDNVKSIDEILVAQVRRLSEFVEAWAKHDLKGVLSDYDHVFFAYTVLEALKVAQGAWSGIINPWPISWEITRDLVLKRMTLDFYSQMTFHFAGLSQHVDIIALTLATYSIRKFAVGDNSAIRIPDDVIDAAIDTVIILQNKAGTWDTTTPLLGAATGRVGCSSIELAICLLRIPKADQFFERLQPSFERLLEYVLRGFHPEHPTIGWGTDIRRNGSGRQTWYSFLVFSFLYLFVVRARRCAANLLLSTFRVSYGSRRPNWSQLGDYKDFKKTLQSNIIEPWRSGEAGKKGACSAILFGPPGTGKSSIVAAMAGELNLPLVEIGPSDFLKDGVDGIFANGDQVFQRLLLLDDVVVLFDEVDELVVERDGGVDKMSKFLTTYMLPWLQRLRDRSSLIFIFATNHIERFDPAIRRHGRFDFIVPVGPPQGEERVRVVRALLEKRRTIPETFFEALKQIDVVPPQTTLGDIMRVSDKLSDEELGQMALLRDAFKPAGLLIKEFPEANRREWTDFLKACETYST